MGSSICVTCSHVQTCGSHRQPIGEETCFRARSSPCRETRIARLRPVGAIRRGFGMELATEKIPKDSVSNSWDLFVSACLVYADIGDVHKYGAPNTENTF